MWLILMVFGGSFWFSEAGEGRGMRDEGRRGIVVIFWFLRGFAFDRDKLGNGVFF